MAEKSIPLLQALRVPISGPLASMSSRLAGYLVSERFGSQAVCLNNRLQGTVVVVPIYPRGRAATWAEVPDARLSLASCLATWRVGGIVAPVTPKLMEPQRDLNGLLPGSAYQYELPSRLEQWTPGVVLTFGSCEEMLLRMLRLRGTVGRSPWLLGALSHLRLGLRLKAKAICCEADTSPTSSSRSSKDAEALLEDRVLYLAPAIELPGGEQITFRTMLGAVADPADGPPLESAEGALIDLLRAAASRRGKRGAGKKEAVVSHTLRPRRAPPASNWTPVLDSQTGGTYFWNQQTDETVWEVPASGRWSALVVHKRIAAYCARLPKDASRRTARRSQNRGSPKAIKYIFSSARRRSKKTDELVGRASGKLELKSMRYDVVLEPVPKRQPVIDNWEEEEEDEDDFASDVRSAS